MNWNGLVAVSQDLPVASYFAINDFCRRELGLLERISGESVTSLVNQRIKHHVEHTCRGNFESPFLESLEQVNFNKNIPQWQIQSEWKCYCALKLISNQRPEELLLKMYSWFWLKQIAKIIKLQYHWTLRWCVLETESITVRLKLIGKNKAFAINNEGTVLVCMCW